MVIELDLAYTGAPRRLSEALGGRVKERTVVKEILIMMIVGSEYWHTICPAETSYTITPP